VDTAAMLDALKKLDKEAEKLVAAESGAQQKLDSFRADLEQRQSALRESEAAVQRDQRDLHTREGHLASLTELQAGALAVEADSGWLKTYGLDKAPRLAEAIKVTKGWETAVETVLGQWLQSITASNDAKTLKAFTEVGDSRFDLVDDSSGALKAKSGTLAEKVKAPDVVTAWLNSVQLADTLEQAWKERGNLGESESCITQAGEWLGAGWIRIARGKAGEEGMLTREKAISELQAEIKTLAAKVEKQLKANEKERAELGVLQARTQELQQEVNAHHRRLSEVTGQAQSRRSNMELLDERQLAIGKDVSELKEQIKHDEKSVRLARARLDELVEAMATLKKERDVLDDRRKELIGKRDKARSELQQARDQRHELALKAESRRASLDSLRQSLERMDTQLSQLQQRYVNLSEQVAKADQPDKSHTEEMDALLERRVATEQRLAEERKGLEDLEEQYREQDAARQASVQKSDEIRQLLERSRLQQQEVELNARALERQVKELGADVAALQESIPEDADTTEWETQLASLQDRIVRLEPVNLAAIDEFEEEQKRKEYLDAQNDDLCQALATLEEAIAKIDRKTRTRFKETFERVNKGVQELFPRLFGGGHAYLELTGEDLLSAGVAIMARPPGKRVSNIHLLSGGEKALTAVSFVFAIFQLNPAPFCLLDEVDAPLDDSNVARFSGMVKELAETVQFIFVTHNKITMEMAHQMSGVTMREPGVSRLVQVDIDEAAKLVAS